MGRRRFLFRYRVWNWIKFDKYFKTTFNPINEKSKNKWLKFAKAIFSKEILSETLTSALTFGIVGSCFPTSHPEVVPEITPAIDMDFNTDFH